MRGPREGRQTAEDFEIEEEIPTTNSRESAFRSLVLDA